MRRTPLEQDDAYELQDHEFTLEADEVDSAERESPWPFDELTAPWSTLPPLPAWASKARALLEAPITPAIKTRVFYDDTPTPVHETVECSISELRAIREEAAAAKQESQERLERIELLERALEDASRTLADAAHDHAVASSELVGRVNGLTARMREAEAAVCDLQSARDADARARVNTLARPPNAPRGDELARLAAEFVQIVPRERTSGRKPAKTRRPAPRDDLQRIDGIGKRFAKRLHELGIGSFARLAALRPAETARLAEQLGVRRERIETQWIKQARRLKGRKRPAATSGRRSRRT